MPWKETNVMEQRTLFIDAWLTRQYSKTELCQRFGISRPTADKWIQRYRQNGLAGLADQSRRPHHSPNATDDALRERLIAAKQQRPHWGAKKLLGLLRMQHPDIDWPSNSTGERLLKQAGLVQPRRHRNRFSADNSPFVAESQPNQSWSTDFKGDFLMKNGRRCYPLAISDNYSRKLLLCNSLGSTAYQGVRPLFERIFAEYGLPYTLVSDNGTPFASRALGGLSSLSKWWIDLGIRPQRINPGHPEQNGRHERMHRSLKEYLLKLYKIEHDLAAQQQQFDAFLQEYNEMRIHEGLGGQIPEELYRPSSRSYSGIITAYDYDDAAQIRQVRSNGEIKWRGQLFYISQVLVGEAVALMPYGDGVWRIDYRFHPLGLMNDRTGKVERLTQWREIPRPQP